MYDKNTDKDLIGAGLTAGLGGGIVTSFAVGLGQHPIIAIVITAIVAMVGVLFRMYDIA